ncbi:TlpA family protein disulfide reductase [Siccirubricoccus deserti]|uniref:TlpA family protein disulfide reductase n=1 Tax=Siccirubricoccus deserti TaxID=2013562 RepID=A0A9X0UD34_9PROT|nr:TlpA disulfide reductase family protein [Siccirubricoccus deserti]MBC4015221.1 TlpA family protein disulfide reductase [Siccirubricoccus deserti]
MPVLSSLRAPRRAMALAAAGTVAAALAGRKARADGLGKLAESPPRPLPEFGFTDAEGKPHGVGDFAGQGLVLNLWATWCPPCVAEMPALDRAQAALAAEGITVLALSSDRGGRAQVEPFYRDRGIRHLGLWLDPRGAAGRALGVRGLPTTLIIDRQGRERARLEGAAEWDQPAMLAAIRRLVAVEEPQQRT